MNLLLQATSAAAAQANTLAFVSYVAFPVYIVLAVGMITVLMILPRIIARYTTQRTKEMPYECGVDPEGSANQRFSVHFYLVAVLFILFDIEAVFLFPWATALQELGLAGFIEAVVFVAILALGLGYAWRKGVLDWNH